MWLQSREGRAGFGKGERMPDAESLSLPRTDDTVPKSFPKLGGRSRLA